MSNVNAYLRLVDCSAVGAYDPRQLRTAAYTLAQDVRACCVSAEPSAPRDLRSVTYTHSDVMVMWHAVAEPRGDVTDIVYTLDFRSADSDDVTWCSGQWSVNGSLTMTHQLDTAGDDRQPMSTLVTSLCPDTEFVFTVISWTVVFSYIHSLLENLMLQSAQSSQRNLIDISAITVCTPCLQIFYNLKMRFHCAR